MQRVLVAALVALFAMAPGIADAQQGAARSSKKNWAPHMGDVPFVVGFEKGVAEAKFTGRPMMVFFTTTW